MAKTTIGDFRVGVRGDLRNAPALELMENCKSDRQGRLVPRNGSANRLVSAEESGLITVLQRCRTTYDLFMSVPSGRVFARVLAASSIRVKLDSGTTWGNVQSESVSPAANVAANRREDLFCKPVSIGDRLIFPMDSIPYWYDLVNTHLYRLGRAVPTTPTDALVAGGSLSNGSFYGYTYTYYSDGAGDSSKEVETAPSAVTTANPSGGNLTVRLTLTRTPDAQWNNVRIYRTTARTTDADAQSATRYLLTTQTHTPGTGTFTYDDTGAVSDATLQTNALESAVSDHTVLGTVADESYQFAAVYQGVLFLAKLPRTVVWCKNTTTAVYPDWYPAENAITKGDQDEVISGLEVSPYGDALYVFTNKRIWTIRGTNIHSNFNATESFDTMGCPFPRTIAMIERKFYFLGSDLGVWVFDGRETVKISQGVDHHLEHLNPAWREMPCAVGYENQYLLSYPSDTPLTTSSTTIGVTTPATNLLTATLESPYRLTDTGGTPWTLTNAKIGMWVVQVTNRDRTGLITAVGANYVDVEGYRTSDYQAGPAASKAYEIRYADRVLVFDATYPDKAYWHGPHKQNINAFSYWDTDGGQLYGARSDGGYVDQLDTGTTDLTLAGATQAITAIARTVLQDAPTKSAGQSLKTVKGMQVYMDADSETALTVRAYRNGADSATDTQSAWTPSATNLYEVLFGASGVEGCATWMGELEGATMGPIHRWEIETID